MGRCWNFEDRECLSWGGCSYPLHCELAATTPRKIFYDCSDSDATHFTAKSSVPMFFQCGRCRQIKSVKGQGGTGYVVKRSDDSLMCYDCCGQTDRLYMLDHDQIILYLTKQGDEWIITNWPGTLKYVCKSVHPLKGQNGRVAYFSADGREWRARNLGDNDIATCRRMKAEP